ncbi:MAG: DUF3152 domain-containing protein [Phycicoccus sp.]|nr:DUF3152 domain-containing protein [Phycicoccus sp.]
MPSRESRSRAHRRVIRRRRHVVGGGLLLFVTLLVLAGVRLAGALTGDTDATVPVASRSGTPITTPTSHAGSASTPSKSPSKAPSGTASGQATGVRATGEYVSAVGGTDRYGSGTLKTYAVQVEKGTGQRVPDFAAAVDVTLADPASWTGQGRWSLQRVAIDKADFVIRLATPATVDKVCATVGLDTRGYVSCRAGNFVMINLDRWLKAIPEYQGDVALYRQYLINHEVGHSLGYTHQACPGPGRLAPVMQQQTFGLDGCRANGSPYVDGVLIAGPSVP